MPLTVTSGARSFERPTVRFASAARPIACTDLTASAASSALVLYVSAISNPSRASFSTIARPTRFAPPVTSATFLVESAINSYVAGTCAPSQSGASAFLSDFTLAAHLLIHGQYHFGVDIFGRRRHCSFSA